MTRCKIVWFDRAGACLLYKRLHDARFALPASGDAPGVRIDGPALAQLLDGVPRPARRGTRM